MNILDALILLPIGYFAYKGFMAGLIQEVLSIAGIILGVFVTFAYMKPFSEIIEPYFNSPDTAAIVAGDCSRTHTFYRYHCHRTNSRLPDSEIPGSYQAKFYKQDCGALFWRA